MPRKLTFKASLRDMVDDTRSLDDIRPGEKLDVTLRKFIPQEFAAEVTYYDYAGRSRSTPPSGAASRISPTSSVPAARSKPR